MTLTVLFVSVSAVHIVQCFFVPCSDILSQGVVLFYKVGITLNTLHVQNLLVMLK